MKLNQPLLKPTSEFPKVHLNHPKAVNRNHPGSACSVFSPFRFRKRGSRRVHREDSWKNIVRQCVAQRSIMASCLLFDLLRIATLKFQWVQHSVNKGNSTRQDFVCNLLASRTCPPCSSEFVSTVFSFCQTWLILWISCEERKRERERDERESAKSL